MHLLITRPHKQAIKTAKVLENSGHTSIVEPCLIVEPLVTKPPSGNFGGVILTSANACDALDRNWPQEGREKIPVLATGAATRNAALNIGFKNGSSVDGSALKLVEQTKDWMKEQGLPASTLLLYPCAKMVAHDIMSLLALKSVSCTPWPVYEASARTELTSNTVSQLKKGKFDAVLLYSARTAETFVSLLFHHNVSLKEINTYVLSREIFDALPDELKMNCRYPDEPNEQAIIRLLTK